MAATDRRRHVRLKPTAEVPARVALLGDGPMREALDVIDISIGGMALASPALKGSTAGARMRLVITLGTLDEQAVEVVTRWASAEWCGKFARCTCRARPGSISTGWKDWGHFLNWKQCSDREKLKQKDTL